ncbi:MAG: S41 family peptidase [Oceanobacter sp.]
MRRSSTSNQTVLEAQSSQQNQLNNLMAPDHWLAQEGEGRSKASNKLVRNGHALATTLLAATLALTGCGSDDTKSSSSADINLSNHLNNSATSTGQEVERQGIWYAPEEGSLVIISSDSLTAYDLVGDYCQWVDEMSPEDMDLDEWQLSEDGKTMEQTFTAYGVTLSEFRLNKLETLPEACNSEHVIAQIGEADYEADALRDFEIFYQTFEHFYPSFEQRGVDWAATRAELETSLSLTSNSDNDDLLQALSSMIYPLKDSHVEVSLNAISSGFTDERTLYNRLAAEFESLHGTINSDEQFIAFQNYYGQQLELLNQLRFQYASSDIEQAANDQISWYTTNMNGENIGVLIIDAMIGFSQDSDDWENEDLDSNLQLEEFAALNSAMQQAISDLADTDGLIVDVRLNGGGLTGADRLIASYFLDTERDLYQQRLKYGDEQSDWTVEHMAPADISYLKPVVLLISANSISAAETFALAMRELPQVTLMGEATQGALSDILSKELPGGIEFDLINQTVQSMSGEWFEGLGVPVDIEVEYATLDNRSDETDAGLEAAWALLTSE